MEQTKLQLKLPTLAYMKRLTSAKVAENHQIIAYSTHLTRLNQTLHMLMMTSDLLKKNGLDQNFSEELKADEYSLVLSIAEPYNDLLEKSSHGELLDDHRAGSADDRMKHNEEGVSDD